MNLLHHRLIRFSALAILALASLLVLRFTPFMGRLH